MDGTVCCFSVIAYFYTVSLIRDRRLFSLEQAGGMRQRDVNSRLEHLDEFDAIIWKYQMGSIDEVFRRLKNRTPGPRNYSLDTLQ